MAATLKATLDRLYAAFDADASVADPVRFVHRYADHADREIVAFCASGLAFGRVASILHSVDSLLRIMGTHPARFVRQFDPSRDGRALRSLGHRWITGEDLTALVWLLRQMLERAGSIEQFFLAGYEPSSADLYAALDSFSSRARALDLTAAYGRRVPLRPGVFFFFPRPAGGSGCKRLNLFLRWMVRRDRIDPGGWTAILASKLVVPLDTHVVRVGRCLGLTRYRSPGWRMAAEISATLRNFDPVDPIKYDFALCHVGMLNLCRTPGGRLVPECPLRRFCGDGPGVRGGRGRGRLSRPHRVPSGSANRMTRRP